MRGVVEPLEVTGLEAREVVIEAHPDVGPGILSSPF
jgi:hypothetical protein